MDWPLLEHDEEEGRFYAAHHPFTMPVREDLDLIETAPEDMKAQAYDLVLNGYELGGGSIRIFEKTFRKNVRASRLYKRRSGGGVRIPS